MEVRNEEPDMTTFDPRTVRPTYSGQFPGQQFPGPVPPPVHLDPDLRELQHQLHPVQHRRLRPGHRPLPERPPAPRPHRHQLRVDLQLQPLPVSSPVHHLGHASLLPPRSERSA